MNAIIIGVGLGKWHNTNPLLPLFYNLFYSNQPVWGGGGGVMGPYALTMPVTVGQPGFVNMGQMRESVAAERWEGVGWFPPPMEGIFFNVFLLLFFFFYFIMKTVFSCALLAITIGVVYVVAKTNSLLFFFFLLLVNQRGRRACPPCAPLATPVVAISNIDWQLAFGAYFIEWWTEEGGVCKIGGRLFIIGVYFYLFVYICNFIFIFGQTGPYQKLPALKSWKSYHMASPPLWVVMGPLTTIKERE